VAAPLEVAPWLAQTPALQPLPARQPLRSLSGPARAFGQARENAARLSFPSKLHLERLARPRRGGPVLAPPLSPPLDLDRLPDSLPTASSVFESLGTTSDRKVTRPETGVPGGGSCRPAAAVLCFLGSTRSAHPPLPLVQPSANSCCKLFWPPTKLAVFFKAAADPSLASGGAGACARGRTKAARCPNDTSDPFGHPPTHPAALSGVGGPCLGPAACCQPSILPCLRRCSRVPKRCRDGWRWGCWF